MKFNRLIPEFTVRDIKKSIDFYTNVLGFTLEYQREEKKFAFLSFKGAQIMLEEKKGSPGKGINFQIETDDVEALLLSIQRRNHPIKTPLRDNWYRVNDKYMGNREFIVEDPDGYLLRFFKDIGVRQQ
jgi:catechol 2,3-dioxygenase-like lactoylglutathione lyase family enzyme